MAHPSEINHRPEGPKQVSITNFIRTFSKEANNPPGKDECMGAFYTALTDLSVGDETTRNYLQNIVARRKFTPQHLTNLIFRVAQYVELFEKKNDNYPFYYTGSNQWQEEIRQLLKDHGNLISELLLTKDTTTTLYQRYAGPKAALNAIFPAQVLKVADFGCGGNYGLPGLAKNIAFKPITDQTPNRTATQLIRKQVHIQEGLSIDKVDPQDPEEKKWRLACSFYPKELGQLAELSKLEEQLADVQNVRFLQADLLNLQVNHENGSLPASYYDAVVMSTLCYQQSIEEQKRVFELARKSLKKDGIFIVQDFARKNFEDPKHLEFLSNWNAEPFTYRTFISGDPTNGEFKEFLKWSNGRCLNVRPGEDFNELIIPI